MNPETLARIERWKADPGVLGVVLVGSRSRGHADGLSDDDLEVVLRDEAAAALPPEQCLDLGRDEGTGRLLWDTQYIGLSGLASKLGSRLDLDHWPYERAAVVHDTGGRVADLVQQLREMDAGFRQLRLQHGTLGAIFSARRALKTRQRGFAAAEAMLVGQAARALARVLFALEHRWTPMWHWLEPELQTLDDPTSAGPLLVVAVAEGRAEAVLEAMTGLQPALEEAGVPGPEGYTELFLRLIHPGAYPEMRDHYLE